MPASPLDSGLYRDLFTDVEVARLFTDSAEVRAMLLVEGALAKAQAKHGLIPEISAAAIQRAAMEVQIDPTGLAAETACSAVPVPALVAAFRTAMEAPEHSQYIHWGATSQDIMDTALALRLRQVMALFDARIRSVLTSLATLAEDHAETPMAGRTYGQLATPTSFGALAASWGAPLLGPVRQRSDIARDLLHVSLSGAAGTLSVMEDKGPDVRASLAEALKLSDPGGTWHSNRSAIAQFAGWMTMVASALGKMGEDLLILTQSGIDEIDLTGTGSSSTMPQKANPVAPSALVALARHAVGLNATLQAAPMHRLQRDGAAWLTEWLTLPQLCQTLGGALRVADETLQGLGPNPQAMTANIDPSGLGLIYAEALSFALTRQMPRPEAQAQIAALCAEARTTSTPLPDLAQRDIPDLDVSSFTPLAQMGQAPREARAFASAIRALLEN